MGEALRVIEITDACPADRLFVSQIRLQRLKQRADDIRQQDEGSLGTENDAASAPRLLYLKTLRRQLHELRASVAPDLQQIGRLYLQACIFYFVQQGS
jgi:ribosomal protein L19E